MPDEFWRVPRPSYLKGGAFCSVPLGLTSRYKDPALEERQGRGTLNSNSQRLN
jgi:hypothetical protein